MTIERFLDCVYLRFTPHLCTPQFRGVHNQENAKLSPDHFRRERVGLGMRLCQYRLFSLVSNLGSPEIEKIFRSGRMASSDLLLVRHGLIHRQTM